MTNQHDNAIPFDAITRTTAHQLRALIRDAIVDDLDARDARLSLLAIETDAKTRKGSLDGILTGILYLLPHKLSGTEACAWRDGCERACLFSAGRGGMDSVKRGRARKHALLLRNPRLFWLLMLRDVRALERKAARRNMLAACRPNGTSDYAHEWTPEFRAIVAAHPNVAFYDYTKAPVDDRPGLPGYDLTRSRGARMTDETVRQLVAMGERVAVVFRDRIPTEWLGLPVTNGDEHDHRFTEGPGIIGLLAKGKAKTDRTGFVVDVD